jgi:circadian clock protein KaiB
MPTKLNKTARAFEKAAADRSELFYVLRLFVVGMSPKSQDAIANVRKLCEKYLKGQFSLEVIDIHQHPLSASENQILAAPTLIKKLPLPLRKFVGDMKSMDKILAGLDVRIDAIESSPAK